MEDYIYYYKIKSGSIGKTALNLIQYLLNWWRTIFCQLAYLLASNEKKKLILSDFGTYSNTVKSIIFGKHARNLFYHRMGRASILYAWILPGESSLLVPFSCTIGKHCHFVHNRGSHLNASAIGDDFICYAHVVMGAKKLQSQDLPIVGNRVTLGTGVVIVGGITIGNNVQIAANAFVNRSVPDNCVVVGNPARIVKKDGEKCDIPL